MSENEFNTTEAQTETDYETVETLAVEEGDYFPVEEIERATYGEDADDDEWKHVFRTRAMCENNSTHLVRDPEGTYVLFSTNIDNYHKIKQIGDRVGAEPVTPTGEDVSVGVVDAFRENVLGDRGNIYECEFRGSTIHITLRFKDGWPEDELEILGEASRRDVAYDVNLVRDTPTMDEIVEALTDGDRDIVDDADEIESVEKNRIEVRHEGSDGEVVVQHVPDFAWRLGDDEEEMMSDEELQALTVKRTVRR